MLKSIVKSAKKIDFCFVFAEVGVTGQLYIHVRAAEGLSLQKSVPQADNAFTIMRPAGLKSALKIDSAFTIVQST